MSTSRVDECSGVVYVPPRWWELQGRRTDEGGSRRLEWRLVGWWVATSLREEHPCLCRFIEDFLCLGAERRRGGWLGLGVWPRP